MSILGRKYKPVMEAYHGKPKEFIAIENELDKLLKIMKQDLPKLRPENIGIKMSNLPKLTDLNSSDHVVAIQNLFKKFFSCRDFILTFYYPISTKVMTIPFNAFTLPRFFNTFYRTGDGKVDTSTLAMGVNVDVMLCVYLDLTAEELMAIILHEIGHNMDMSVFTLLSRLPIDMQLLSTGNWAQIITNFVTFGLFDMLGLGAVLSSVIKSIQVALAKYAPGLLHLSTLYWEIYMNIMTVMKIKNFKNIMNISPDRYVLEIINPNNLFGYASEKYADSFATSYGYGLALSTAFAKLEANGTNYTESTIKNIPGLNWVYDLMSVNIGLIYAAVDPHPLTVTRIQSQLTKLKRDAKDPNLNPKLRKELELQIKDQQNFIDNYYLDIDKNDNKKRIFSWMMNYMIIKFFNGRFDFRETFELLCPHEE